MSSLLTDSRVMRQIGLVAAICWLLSWVLSVVEGYPGWAAFRAALSGPFRESFPVRGDDAVPLLLSALTNGVWLLQFVHWKVGRVRNWTLYLKVAIACLLVNLY